MAARKSLFFQLFICQQGFHFFVGARETKGKWYLRTAPSSSRVFREYCLIDNTKQMKTTKLYRLVRLDLRHHKSPGYFYRLCQCSFHARQNITAVKWPHMMTLCLDVLSQTVLNLHGSVVRSDAFPYQSSRYVMSFLCPWSSVCHVTCSWISLQKMALSCQPPGSVAFKTP